MNDIFKHTSSHWVKYSEYQWKKSKGTLYLTPTDNAKIMLYDPLKDDNADNMVLDALNVGIAAAYKEADKEENMANILEFARKYGLLGFMTALPTTPKFMDYDAVYLPLNHFLKKEMMKTQDYLDLFYPFQKPDFYKDERTKRWNINNDREMIALAMTMGNSDIPMAMNMSFLRDYAEQYDWLLQIFSDWAFSLTTSFLYFEESEHTADGKYTRDILRKSMAAFEGIAPTYRIILDRKPTIVWDFHSLLLGIQMMFSFMMTDDTKPIQICKVCGKAYKVKDIYELHSICSHACEREQVRIELEEKRGK